MAGVGFVVEDHEDSEGLVEVVLPPVEAKESRKDVHVGDNLEDSQDKEVREILQEYDHVLTDVPRKTNLIQHSPSYNRYVHKILTLSHPSCHS